MKRDARGLFGRSDISCEGDGLGRIHGGDRCTSQTQAMFGVKMRDQPAREEDAKGSGKSDLVLLLHSAERTQHDPCVRCIVKVFTGTRREPLGLQITTFLRDATGKEEN